MKMKNTKINYVLRNYASESVNIALECCNYLLENNFYQNQEIENIELLEKAIINYSILKLANWKINLEELGIENWDNLEAILGTISKNIPTEKEREEFFAQYTHAIIFIYGKIEKELPITWIRKEETKVDYIYLLENGKLKEFITKKSVTPYEIPITLLAKIKSFYAKEKNPVLKK